MIEETRWLGEHQRGAGATRGLGKARSWLTITIVCAGTRLGDVEQEMENLPPHLCSEVDRLKRRLVLTLELIREVEAERDATLSAAPPRDEACRKIAALSRIRGVGDNFATVLTREVFYRRFGGRRQLASYVGIAPMPHQSGTMDRDRRIGRAGKPPPIMLPSDQISTSTRYASQMRFHVDA